jgi:hypothetical protein
MRAILALAVALVVGPTTVARSASALPRDPSLLLIGDSVTAGIASAIVDASAVSICDRDSLLKTPDKLLTLEQRAFKYAPCLRFTSTERFLPTIPFFSAFDGENNDSTATDIEIDFADPGEISPTSGGKWDWSKMRNRYQKLSKDEKLRVAAGFVRVRPVDSRRVAQILKSDGPRYYRLNWQTRKYMGNRRPMTAYEYYFYYVNDTGIKGHPEDIETFFVFVPDEAPGSADSTNFFVLVGAAHSDGDANNVAIYEWLSNEPTPQVCAFVELGGHAMAPDVPPLGELYRHGFDTNWHAGDAWGIRDAIATGAGGSLRRFDGWMVENRDPAAMIKPICADRKKDNPTANTYVLISAEEFYGPAGLYGPAAVDSTMDIAAAKQAIRAMSKDLPLTGSTKDSIDRLDAEGLARMLSWSRDGIAQKENPKEVREAKRHIVTRHASYTAPSSTGILKPYLFGSNFPFPFVRRTAGPSGDPRLYAGAEMGLVALSRVKSWLSMQGGLRLGVSYEFNQEDVAVDLGYFTSMARRFTEYALVGTSFPDYHVGVGFIYRTNPWFALGRAKFIELRAGVLTWHEEDLRFSKPTLEFSVAIPWGGARY